MLFSMCIASIILVIEATSRIFSVPKITHHKIVPKAHNLLPKINENAIVFIGDSRIEWGIKPILFEEKLGEEKACVYNLAMPGSNGMDVLKYLKNNKINPKLIVVGYTRNYGRYVNHNLDSLNYSNMEWLRSNVGYWLKQRMYILDQSIWECWADRPVFFRSHEYDEQGGVVVFENGDFKERLAKQTETYTTWKKTFSGETLQAYKSELKELVGHFRASGVPVYGIYMPVSKGIYALEQQDESELEAELGLTRFEDLSNFVYTNEIPGHDSIYFLDGSHLSHDYALVFTEKLAKMTKKHLREDKE